jgi:8-amino-7-oxononanoate synthase
MFPKKKKAHATGVFGEHGRGVVCRENLEDEIFARVHTFGKALASNGGKLQIGLLNSN